MVTTDEQPGMAERNVCIVGGGPAGILLGLLLSRVGIPVTLLEAHADFDRDFRGDTIHPYTLNLLDELGLIDDVLKKPHIRVDAIEFESAAGPVPIADFSKLGGKHPYEILMPQVDFLDFLATEFQKNPCSRLLMRSTVVDLLRDGDRIRGVRYQDTNGTQHELPAALVIGADGRHSRVRKLAGIEPMRSSTPMDVVWMRFSRKPHDAAWKTGIRVVFGEGYFVVATARPNREYQVGYVIVKGAFSDLRSQGLDIMKQNIVALYPFFADRIDELQNFQQVSVLSADSSLCKQWWQPGLLLIGDAAHVMSPVGGIGIKYAVQDAVSAANLLHQPLLRGNVSTRDLAKVQRQRYRSVKFAQKFQVWVHERVIKPALHPSERSRLGLWNWLNKIVPVRRWIAARFLGYGLFPPKLAAIFRTPRPLNPPVK